MGSEESSRAGVPGDPAPERLDGMIRERVSLLEAWQQGPGTISGVRRASCCGWRPRRTKGLRDGHPYEELGVAAPMAM